MTWNSTSVLTYEMPRRKVIRRTWISVIIIYTLHPLGTGAWVIVLYDFLLVAIAKNDLALATAYWGGFELLNKIAKLVTSPMLGEFADRQGRKRCLQLIFGAAISNVTIVYFIPSIITFFLGAVISCFDIIDIVILSIIPDIGKAMVYSKDEESREKVVPEIEESSIPERTAAELKTAVAKKTTWMYGLTAATWVLSIGISAVIASVIVQPPNSDGEADDTPTHNETATDVVAAGCENSTATNEKTFDDFSYLLPAVVMSLCGFIPGLLFSTFFFNETRDWLKPELDIKAKANSKVTIFESFKLLMGTNNWLRILTGCIMFTEVSDNFLFRFLREKLTLLRSALHSALRSAQACQNGSINIFFWFGKYHFDWTLVDFTLFLLWALILSSIGTTCVLNEFLKNFGLWGSLDISCVGGVIGLTVLGLSGVLGEWAMFVGVGVNLVNVSKPVLRGKICAEFPASEQGKVQGALYVVIAFADILGNLIVTSFLSLAIMYEQGVEEVDPDGCLMGKKETGLVGGAPFFGLAMLSALAFVLVQMGKRYEPDESKIERGVTVS